MIGVSGWASNENALPSRQYASVPTMATWIATPSASMLLAACHCSSARQYLFGSLNGDRRKCAARYVMIAFCGSLTSPNTPPTLLSVTTLAHCTGLLKASLGTSNARRRLCATRMVPSRPTTEGHHCDGWNISKNSLTRGLTSTLMTRVWIVLQAIPILMGMMTLTTRGHSYIMSVRPLTACPTSRPLGPTASLQSCYKQEACHSSAVCTRSSEQL